MLHCIVLNWKNKRLARFKLQSITVGGFLFEQLEVDAHGIHSGRTWSHYFPDTIEDYNKKCKCFFISHVADISYQN